MGKIETGPHYEIPSAELAKWLEQQAADSWWNVDGDPLLTGRLSIPCPTDELAAELRKIDRPLLVEAKVESAAKGQVISASEIGAVVHFEGDPKSPWGDDRFFRMCWKESPHEWFLIEDSVSAKQFLEDAALKGK